LVAPIADIGFIAPISNALKYPATPRLLIAFLLFTFHVAVLSTSGPAVAWGQLRHFFPVGIDDLEYRGYRDPLTLIE
jgi:hypothetical protein